MIFELIFIFAFSLGAFAQNNPITVVNGDEISYGMLLGDLEFYLRHNVTGTKKCYMDLKQEYFNALQSFGWNLMLQKEKGTFDNLGSGRKEKEKVKTAANILREKIGGDIYNSYHNQLSTKIQALHFGSAVILMDRRRDVIREDLEAYKKVMSELKKAKVYKDLEKLLGGSLREIMDSTGEISKKLTACIKKEKCLTG